MAPVKDSRLAVRLSTQQDALIRRAADAVGASITEFTVAATVNHAVDVLSDRRMFVIDDGAWEDFMTALDQPVRPRARLQQLLSEPSVFTES